MRSSTGRPSKEIGPRRTDGLALRTGDGWATCPVDARARLHQSGYQLASDTVHTTF
jgi:hypothetical protein